MMSAPSPRAFSMAGTMMVSSSRLPNKPFSPAWGFSPQTASLGSFTIVFGESVGSVKSLHRFDLWSVRRALHGSPHHGNQTATDHVGNKGHAEVFSLVRSAKISVWPGGSGQLPIASLFAGRLPHPPSSEAGINRRLHTLVARPVCALAVPGTDHSDGSVQGRAPMLIVPLIHLRNLANLKRFTGLFSTGLKN